MASVKVLVLPDLQNMGTEIQDSAVLKSTVQSKQGNEMKGFDPGISCPGAWPCLAEAMGEKACS